MGFARIMASPWTIKLKVFVFLPFIFFHSCGFNLITIQLVLCNGSMFEYNLHFLEYGIRLLNQQMFDSICSY